MTVEVICFEQPLSKEQLELSIVKENIMPLQSAVKLPTKKELSVFTARFWKFPKEWETPLSSLMIASTQDIYNPEDQSTVQKRLDVHTSSLDPLITAALPFRAIEIDDKFLFLTDSNQNLAKTIEKLTLLFQQLTQRSQEIDEKLLATQKNDFMQWAFNRERAQLILEQQLLPQMQHHLLLAITEAVYRLNTQMGYMPAIEYNNFIQILVPYFNITQQYLSLDRVHSPQNNKNFITLIKKLYTSFQQAEDPLNIFKRALQYGLKKRVDYSEQDHLHYGNQVNRLFTYLIQNIGGKIQESTFNIQCLIQYSNALTFEHSSFDRIPNASFEEIWKWVQTDPELQDLLTRYFCLLSQRLSNIGIEQFRQKELVTINQVKNGVTLILGIMNCSDALESFNQAMEDTITQLQTPILQSTSSTPSILSASSHSPVPSEITMSRKNPTEINCDRFAPCFALLNSPQFTLKNIDELNKNIKSLKAEMSYIQLDPLRMEIQGKIADQPALCRIYERAFAQRMTQTSSSQNTLIDEITVYIREQRTMADMITKPSEKKPIIHNMLLGVILLQLLCTDQKIEEINHFINTPNHPGITDSALVSR